MLYRWIEVPKDDFDIELVMDILFKELRVKVVMTKGNKKRKAGDDENN